MILLFTKEFLSENSLKNTPERGTALQAVADGDGSLFSRWVASAIYSHVLADVFPKTWFFRHARARRVAWMYLNSQPIEIDEQDVKKWLKK